jgi:hypothetical protein
MSRLIAELPMAVILASTDAPAKWRGVIERWLLELRDEDELIVVAAARDDLAVEPAPAWPRVRVLRRPAGRLAPELWRDGLEATDQPLVAFSTTSMVPAKGWRRGMLGRLEATGAAVVGGPIRPPQSRDPLGRAVFLLRYVRYFPPVIDPRNAQPPGDNAVYRRDRLEGLESLWEEGFWEVEIHRALRARGEQTAMAELGLVEHQGEAGLLRLIQERHAHAYRYGVTRAREFGVVRRLMQITAGPLVPMVLLGRMAVALWARGQSLVPWLPAVPCLLPLLVAWSLGEARGMRAGLLGSLGRDPVRCDDGLVHLTLPTRRCWHGRRWTRGWFSGGGSRVPGRAAGGGGDGRAGLPAGGGL